LAAKFLKRQNRENNRQNREYFLKNRETLSRQTPEVACVATPLSRRFAPKADIRQRIEHKREDFRKF